MRGSATGPEPDQGTGHGVGVGTSQHYEEAQGATARQGAHGADIHDKGDSAPAGTNDAVETDIGEGFVMDGYIMEKKVR